MSLVPGLSSFLRRRCGSAPQHALFSFFNCRFFSDANGDVAAGRDSPSPQSSFIIEYLVNRCGFPPEKASDAARGLRRIRSAERPDSVLDFLKGVGFDGSEIKGLVLSNPRLLGLDVEKRLAPNFQALVDLGFAAFELRRFVLSNPKVFNQDVERKVVPRIELWRRLLGSEEHLCKHLCRNPWLLGYDAEKTILPNLNFLRECGISDERLSTVLRTQPMVMVQKPAALRASMEYVEGLGIPRSSKMLLWAINAIHMAGKNGLKAKMQLMMSLGWSESEFYSAFCKAPYLLPLPEKVLRRKMEFLVQELGCDPSYVARCPALLMYGLEKRLNFRHNVTKILKSRGLRCGDHSPYGIMSLSERKFSEKYILPYKDEVPELHELYVTICKQDSPQL